MELGEKIKTLRSERGLSQEALAARLEISRQAVAKWESGQSRPSTANLLALCGVFGVPLDTLVPGGTIPEPPGRKGAGGRVKVVLLVLSLVSLAFSVAVTSSYLFYARHGTEIIGGADGPTAIFVTGPLPFSVFLVWAVTAALVVATAVAYLRGRYRP